MLHIKRGEIQLKYKSEWSRWYSYIYHGTAYINELFIVIIHT